MDRKSEERMEERPITCMPRFRPLRPATAAPAAPTSLFERTREALLRLVMLSVASKTVEVRHEKAVSIGTETHGAGYQLPDSYRSEAVKDCIEFFKRSAEGEREIVA
ncbi:Transducin/WD40 repeat-like superfamily protein [Rhynchospora pubera]|uniref:Transducin/WD40 repeat-like superfamily protein n=1 Tax=Rhynchospora pubera TaxID=906938 RepID=A0AAV8F270_9POAL|nr:Transducin/WD40 repeat-like superfamily protein [Rhynchospora pubera]